MACMYLSHVMHQPINMSYSFELCCVKWSAAYAYCGDCPAPPTLTPCDQKVVLGSAFDMGEIFITNRKHQQQVSVDCESAA